MEEEVTTESQEYAALHRDRMDAESYKAGKLHPNYAPRLALYVCRMCGFRKMIAVTKAVCEQCEEEAANL